MSITLTLGVHKCHSKKMVALEKLQLRRSKNERGIVSSDLESLQKLQIDLRLLVKDHPLHFVRQAIHCELITSHFNLRPFNLFSPKITLFTIRLFISSSGL